MIKYFHELTKEESEKILDQHLTWDECSKLYPQPKWCKYAGAVCGVMGCWSLMDFKITSKKDCLNCDFCSD